MSATKFQEFDGEEDWVVYCERLQEHFTANQIAEEKIKVAILLSSIGSTTYKLLRNLCHPDLPNKKSYKDVVSLLNQQYCPKVNIWRERKKFYETVQEAQESVAEFNAKIRFRAINCEFGAELKNILRDKFTTGLRENDIFEKAS
ncbi:hypothetical protein NQ314_001622 [Rhamnusium bicolor]|uniref:Retrotransposon gag domain-containing protein n=1 Tax=Rhamnusium bicolor TaxID=1586634 RepID=A0AAV8ZS74_9CUCU|nr:hypothetical protein NQ314_001622 [Rhamnusium bicolor]